VQVNSERLEGGVVNESIHSRGNEPIETDRLTAELRPGERVVAVLRPDLDEQLAFREGLLALTDQRLVAFDVGPGLAPRSWPLRDVRRVTAYDRGGVGRLEALGENALLGRWYYTVGRARDAIALADGFRDVLAGAQAEAPVVEAEPEAPESVQPEIVARAGTLWRLRRFARPHLKWLLLGVALTLASTGAGLIPPLLTWPLVDNVLAPYQDKWKSTRDDYKAIERKADDEYNRKKELLDDDEALSSDEYDAKIEELDKEWDDLTDRAVEVRNARLAELKAVHEPMFASVPWLLLGMLGAALAAWALGWGQGWMLARLSERIAADLRNATYAHMQSLSIDYFSGRRTGDLVARISSDTDRICNFLSDTLTDFCTDILMICGSAAMLFYMDWVLALATLCTFPLVAWLTLYTRQRLQVGFLRGSRAWGDMTAILADTIPGVRVVKAFAQENREVDRFRAVNTRIVQANDRVNRLWTFFWPMVALLNQLGTLVAWAFGTWRVYDQAITVGVLTAFLGYIVRFYSRIESMSRMASRTQRAAASAQRIFEVLDRVPSVAEPAHPVAPGRLRGQVELKNVSFRFGNRRVIDDVDLSIAPGEMIGVVGTTGAGKSTLLNLICRFYDVSDGAVLVDGVDIRSYPILDYRRNIGIVLQEPFLFYGTIAENIAYGRPNASLEEIIGAARAARAHEFILQLPDGYDSIVGERGQTLSGGERQRISIARALLIDPRVLILDEATSSVDTQTEIQIQAALDNLVKGRTTIAIAHRLSTLRNAGRILVLDRGRIVETGSHDELLALGGVYKRLHDAQQTHAEHPVLPVTAEAGGVA